MKNYLQKFTMLELSVVVTILLSVVIMFLLLSSKAEAREKNSTNTGVKTQANMKYVTAEEYRHRKLRYERSKMMIDNIRLNSDGSMVEVDPDQKYPEIDPNIPPHLRPSIQEPILSVSPEIYKERMARYERAKYRYERVIVTDDGKYYEYIDPNKDDLDEYELNIGGDMTNYKKPNQTSSTPRPPMLRVSLQEYEKRKLDYETTQNKLSYIRILSDGSIGRIDPNQKFPEINPNVPPHLRPQIQEPLLPVTTEEHDEMLKAAEEAKQRYERVVIGNDGNYYEDMNPKEEELEPAELSPKQIDKATLLQMKVVTSKEYKKRKLDYETTQNKLSYIRILSDGSIGRIDPNQKFPEINPNVPPHLRPQIQEPLLPVTPEEHDEMLKAAEEAKQRYERVIVGGDGKYYENTNDNIHNEVKVDKKVRLKDKSKPEDKKKRGSDRSKQ